eukprot:scaffold94806_cov53-Attheya_sp.AAC.2
MGARTVFGSVRCIQIGITTQRDLGKYYSKIKKFRNYSPRGAIIMARSQKQILFVDQDESDQGCTGSFSRLA